MKGAFIAFIVFSVMALIFIGWVSNLAEKACSEASATYTTAGITNPIYWHDGQCVIEVPTSVNGNDFTAKMSLGDFADSTITLNLNGMEGTMTIREYIKMIGENQ